MADRSVPPIVRHVEAGLVVHVVLDGPNLVLHAASDDLWALVPAATLGLPLAEWFTVPGEGQLLREAFAITHATGDPAVLLLAHAVVRVERMRTPHGRAVLVTYRATVSHRTLAELGDARGDRPSDP